MEAAAFIETVRAIVRDACALKGAHTDEQDAPVNYACLFAQSDAEHAELVEAASKLGSVIKETPTGPLFQVSIETSSGLLRLVKVRRPDPTRPERGDADFTLSDYEAFKRAHLGTSGFSLVERPQMEMIELVETGSDVRVYFSHPTLEVQFGLSEAHGEP